MSDKIETPTPTAFIPNIPAAALFTLRYGYIDDETGLEYLRPEGHIEKRPEMIATLMERGAPILTNPDEIALWQHNLAAQQTCHQYWRALRKTPALKGLLPEPEGYQAWEKRNWDRLQTEV